MIDPKILAEIAKKFNITKHQADVAISSQFEFTRNIIMSGNDEPIRLQYLGIFTVPPWKRESLKKRNQTLLLKKQNVAKTE